MAMKISDKIRRWCKAGYDIDELSELADCIDSEMVELPKDADGVPIHVGDTVYLDDGSKAVVTCIEIGRGSHGDAFKLFDESFSRLPNYLTHERPDSFGCIADELDLWCNSVFFSKDECAKPHDLAERIRKLADKEGK